MKKLLALLLALTMVFAMVACAAEDTKDPADAADATTVNGDGAANDDAADDAAGDEATDETGDDAAADAESDLAYVQDKGTLVVGITYFAPLDYKEEGSDEWIGFDADLAKAFAESLGVSVEFQEITWDYKVEELSSKAIDCVWNGMLQSGDTA